MDFDRKKQRRWLRVTERHLNTTSVLTIEEIVGVWVIDMIDNILLTPNTQKFFKKTDCNEGFIWIQKTSNKRRSFFEITKVQNGGGKRNFVIPADTEHKGGKAFRGLLLEFMKGKKSSYQTTKTETHPQLNKTSLLQMS